MIEGGCFCGAVRYTVEDGEHLVANCHCSMCRRTSGAPFVTWMVVPTSAFQYMRGKPAVLKSSEHGTRYFCSACGTSMACVIDKRPDVIDVTTGSLDEPGLFAPAVAVHEDTKLPWLSVTEKSAS